MKALLLSMLFSVALTGGLRAQGADHGGVNLYQTEKVISALSDMFAACRETEIVFRPDCLSRAFQRAASKISNNPGYWEAHVALTRASRSLIQIVRSSMDSDAGRVRVEGYRLTAVSEAALPGVSRAIEDVIARVQQDLEALQPRERDAFAPIVTVIRTQIPWP